MADPFAGMGEEPSVIPMADPFASPAPAPTPAPRAATSTRSAQSTLDKYGAAVAGADSLFASVRIGPPDEPCFVDGAYFFYERRINGLPSQGNSHAALRHIFRHWYVSRVFCEDGKTYREDFLRLLKLRGFAGKEEELRRLADDPTLGVNQKFFRLFYNIIYKNAISGFYWSESDSPLRQIDPRFVNPDDFYKKMAELSDPTSFLAGYEDCFEELMTFLRAGKAESASDGRAWFAENFPLVMAEKTGCVYTVTEKRGHLQIRSLGKLRDFAQNFADPASLEVMEERLHLFEHFRFNINRTLVPRTEPLRISHARETEDDSVYALTGIAGLAASQAATAYNFYMTLLCEYTESFHPDRITVGGLTFTRRNFYREILSLVTDACAHLSEGEGRTSPEEKQLYLVKSLFSRGVFRDFEKDCEADRLQELRRAFIERDRLDLSAYFAFDVEHEVYIDGQLTDIGGYVRAQIAKGLAELRGHIRKGDTVLDAYFAARVRREDLARATNEIEDLIREYEASLARLNTTA